MGALDTLQLHVVLFWNEFWKGLYDIQPVLEFGSDMKSQAVSHS